MPALCAALVLGALAADVQAQRVYKRIGPDGSVSYSDEPPPGQRRETAPATRKPAAGTAPRAAPAALLLMGYESTVAEFQDACLATLSTSFQKYDGAAKKWRERHAAVLARNAAVLKDYYTPARQEGLRSAARSRARDAMAGFESASAAAKVKWCDDNADAINAGSVDIIDKAQYAQPLLSYSTRR
jgi:hypothetical protein